MIYKQLSTLTALIESRRILVTDIDTWTLFCFDKDTMKCLWVSNLFQDEEDKLFWNEHIIHIGNSFFFTYRNVLRIKEYNEKNNLVGNYDNGASLGADGDYICRMSFEHKGDILLLPGDITGDIWKFSIKKHQFVNMETLLKPHFSKPITDDNKIILDYYLLDDKYWFINRVNNSLCSIERNTLERGEYLPNKEVKLVGFLSPKNSTEIQSLYVYDSEGKIYDFNGSRLSYVKINCLSSDIGAMYKWKQKIFIIPRKESEIIVYSDDLCEKKIIMIPQSYNAIYEVRNYEGGFARAIIKDGICYLPPFSSSGMIILDMRTDKIQHIEMKYSEKWFSQVTKEGFLKIESPKTELVDFLNTVLETENNQIKINKTTFVDSMN